MSLSELGIKCGGAAQVSLRHTYHLPLLMGFLLQIHVFPLEHERAQAAIQVTKTTKPAEGTQSRRERRLAAYKGKPRKNAAAAAAPVAA